MYSHAMAFTFLLILFRMSKEVSLPKIKKIVKSWFNQVKKNYLENIEDRKKGGFR